MEERLVGDERATRRADRILRGDIVSGMTKRHRNPNVSTAIVASLAALSQIATGCSAKKKVEPWTPKPRVDWKELAPLPVTAIRNQFRILASEPTKGLFPANMAVTRVAVEESKKHPRLLLPHLYADPRNEFLQWNSVFDDQMAVSEVFPISERDLGGGRAEPQQILAAFRALHARLGLIYAVNELQENQTEMFGVLYDTATGGALASVHAYAESMPVSEDEKKPDDPYVLWKTDSRALVRAKFAELMHHCVRQLILNDQPAEVQPPIGWTPSGPTRPVEWPPRRQRHRQ